MTASPSRSDTEKQAAEAEYDVSKTIVDGSNPMKLGQPPLIFPGKWNHWNIQKGFDCSFVIIYRVGRLGPINVYQFNAPRTTTKAQTIRPCTLGRESPTRSERDGPEGPFLTGRH
jgi:hypothetical protein